MKKLSCGINDFKRLQENNYYTGGIFLFVRGTNVK